MKTLSIPLSIVLAAWTSWSEAAAPTPAGKARTRSLCSVQSERGTWPRYAPPAYPHRPHYSFRASTAAGSYARGIAAVIYAQGCYNRLTAEARLIHAEAYRREIANREMAVESYFAVRQANREARAAERGPRPTAADLARLATREKPDRLGPKELNALTGKLLWPLLLRGEEFAALRAALEPPFARRAARGVMEIEQQSQVRQVTRDMLEKLKQFVRRVNAADYTTARRFIEGLAYEARLPVG